MIRTWFRVYDLRFRVEDSKLCLVFRFCGVGLRAYDVGFRVVGLVFEVEGSGSRVQVLWFRVWDLGLRV